MQGYNNIDIIHSFTGDETTGCLYLGDYTSSKNRKLHRQHNITTVITTGLGMKVALSQPMKHKMYALYDCPGENIERFFDQSYSHIQEGLQNGNVLVHCYAGVSRSSTIVISYLMKKLGWGFKQTLDYVRKKRWVVNPNPGFVRQLRSFQRRLKEGDNPEESKMENSAIFTKTPYKTSSNPFKNLSSVYQPPSRGVSLSNTKNRSRMAGYSVSRR